MVKNVKQTNNQYVYQYYIITCALQVKHNQPKRLLLNQSNCYTCYTLLLATLAHLATLATPATLATLSAIATLATFAKFACYTCYQRLLHLLLLLRFLLLLHLLRLLRLRVLRYTCCAFYSTFGILASLPTFACYTSCPCYVGYACYIQQVVSIDNPIRNLLHCLMSNPIYFFILSKLTIQFNFPFCLKNYDQDFDQPTRTPLH